MESKLVEEIQWVLTNESVTLGPMLGSGHSEFVFITWMRI